MLDKIILVACFIFIITGCSNTLINKQNAQELAHSILNVKASIGERKVRKVIFVPDKLVNFVV